MEFTKTQTFLNLARSFAGESQAGMRYQLIAKQAKGQGLEVLANTIRTIAKNESRKSVFRSNSEKCGKSRKYQT